VHTFSPPHAARASGSATDRKPWTILVLVCVAEFMVILDVTVVNVALPSIGQKLGKQAPHAGQFTTNGSSILPGADTRRICSQTGYTAAEQNETVKLRSRAARGGPQSTPHPAPAAGGNRYSPSSQGAHALAVAYLESD
jgi:hypothetical protein